LATTVIDRIKESMEVARLAGAQLYRLNPSHELVKLLEHDERKESGKDVKDNWHRLIVLVHERFPEKETPMCTDDARYLEHFIHIWEEIAKLLEEAAYAELRKKAA
jgi:hypothetical protein